MYYLSLSLGSQYDPTIQLGHQLSNIYELAYQDKEGDWLLAEDVPWRQVIDDTMIEAEDVEPFVDLHVLTNDDIVIHSLNAHYIDLIDSHAPHDNTLDKLIDLRHLPYDYTYVTYSYCTNGSCIEIDAVTGVDDVELVVSMCLPPNDEVEKHDILKVGVEVDLELHHVICTKSLCI
ncbi:hypothetical protein RJT34_30476 [Clitoria ternatea]|uniref:Auxin-induced protein n=1 Tax=Clitoria ternatea TaxID=43366 RepID=A0AAN9EUK6_CLITE